MIDKSKSPSRKPQPEEEPRQKAIGSAFDELADAQAPESVGNPLPTTHNNVFEDMSVWLKEEAWTKPAWMSLTRTEKVKMADKNYEDYVLNSLRWRYTRLEGDFRTGYNNYYPKIDLVTARRTIDYLMTAKESLADSNCDTLDVNNLLDMADQYMTWIYPKPYARTKALALAAQLNSQQNPWGDFLQKAVEDPNADIYSAIDITKDALNQTNQNELINNGLQIERLQMLMRWGVIITGLMLVGLPLLVKSDASIFKDSALANPAINNIKTWIAIGTVGVIGAVGAFLSGLLQIRRTKVSLNEFKESILQFRLRPIVGAIFAMFITSLLTWDIISSIKIENAGAYILIAFLCGFSERYFLSLLNINENNEVDTSAVATPQAPATPPTQTNEEGQ
jgi:hypothetical protein